MTTNHGPRHRLAPAESPMDRLRQALVRAFTGSTSNDHRGSPSVAPTTDADGDRGVTPPRGRDMTL
ncbi:hypothetical protein [Nocardioides conyzicola]|uniref:Uncharacterized protein n=1 Tax=Nocardioides conyzicola TaxID=1651781 RepID=A0ABP8XV01_9ACTN